MDYYVAVLSIMGVHILLGLSVYLVAITGQLSFGQQGFYAIGAYVAGVCTALWGAHLVPALLLRVAAAMAGINVTAVKVMAFTSGGFVAGLGGALFVHYSTYVDHDMVALPLAVASVTYPMLGGLGSFWGPILGAAFLIFLTEGLRFLQEFRLVIYGALIILTMIFRPRGIIDEAVMMRIRSLVRRKGAPSPAA